MNSSAIREASRLLSDQFDAVLTDWIDTQKDEGVRRADLFSEAEGRQQTGHLLRAIANGIKRAASGAQLDFNDEDWADLRRDLESITNERIDRGVTPTEMASFVLALKRPIFERLKGTYADDPVELTEQITLYSRVIDAFALHTTEVFVTGREAIIRRQQAELMELSTPVIQLWDGILTLPLIGTLDSGRAQDVMENLLESIVRHQAAMVIVDITGVQTVDTQVAQHLLRTASAVRLMGAECIISGISPRIAQTMVQLGVEVDDIVTRPSIQGALLYAFGRSGLTVVDGPKLGKPRNG
ncbi:STAS domain-containing protein [Acuticoccus sp. MNP-M23]|uniref:STAS domain-containing protein n=1 Tax=Acuticoccus sp. MNP-M23 TaxID=3072793 RepID=UPI0028153460|nr:STAS domain-containing protein [Acuticoccus sp. MNP-M23]WMS43086.1 STAS domain-containing protein [Acuticoccus sp. MNP-M23]